ncbi:tetraspanin family protein [Vibrio europaeus]|uniref:tetraspanin family protein n=1 Tax=Vibrio europaeus TaxID=300876 RepID=UPI00148B632C|nr:tetraspanin family protein [Vibrio europaeus]NOH24309.1 hypothetical protein [Vibrio europaeus]
MKPKISNLWPKNDHTLFFMKTAVLSIGFGICVFAADGYTTLFSSSKFSILGWETSTVGVFMILLELGILAYITHMFSAWYRKTLMQKVYLGVVVICFSLLCYSGMSSYLWKAYSAEYASVLSSGVETGTMHKRIENSQEQIVDLEARLLEQKERVTEVEQKVEELNNQIVKNSNDKSERRTRFKDCSQSVDCSAAIADLDRAAALLETNYASMLKEKARAQDKYSALEDRKEQLLDRISELQLNVENINLESGGIDAERKEKSAAISAIIVSVYNMLGKEQPQEPFKIAVNFIAFIIYPCYILLNMCIGFNSRGNQLAARFKIKHSKLKKFTSRTTSAKTTKIIVPVPANATAAELEAYVEAAKKNEQEQEQEKLKQQQSQQPDNDSNDPALPSEQTKDEAKAPVKQTEDIKYA